MSLPRLPSYRYFQKPPSEEAPAEWVEPALAILQSVRLIQRSHTDSAREPKALRDVHPKHHGLIQGRFVVEPETRLSAIEKELRERLQVGVFGGAVREYPCWIRFSSTSKLRQSDEVADGRGMAIKLIAVAGDRARLPRGDGTSAPEGQQGTQDFVLVNGPAFFARDAAEMSEAATLEAQDRFPSSYFLSRPRALQATLQALRAQDRSPLALSYFSQTPYCLGDRLAVKYRVRPISGVEVGRGSGRGPHYLREGLIEDLSGGEEGRPPIVLEFAVQLALAGTREFPLDDATVVWDEQKSPFIRLATIKIPPQGFVHETRAAMAERIEYSPFFALRAHRPLGSLNFARGMAYSESQRFRRRINGAVALTYDQAEWDAELEQGTRTDLPPVPPPELPNKTGLSELLATVRGLVPALGDGLLEFFQGRRAYAAVGALLVGLLAWTYSHPHGLPAVDLDLPSEHLIPKPVYSAAYRTEDSRKGWDDDPKYLFYHAPTGTEFDGGVPYWVFRALPRIAPENFGGRTDWRVHGFDQLSQTEYYDDYYGLPRGMVLSDTVVHLLGAEIEVKLKRVSFNCATCHSGEVLLENGQREIIPGMPANVVDTVAYKTAFHRTARDPRFTPARLIQAINEVFAEDAERAWQGEGKPPPPPTLNSLEEIVYGLIAKEIRKKSELRPLGWMSRRAENGPGRVDAFGALRFEYLGYSDEEDEAAANGGQLKNTVVDLPSIWNQAASHRPWHHWDGNTKDVRARNFGAIVGVGGTPWSIRQQEVAVVGKWIDQLDPPDYPFGESPAELVQQGESLFLKQCAHCHGRYEAGKLAELRPCMIDPPKPVGTDPGRATALDDVFIRKLNDFGLRSGLWGENSFRVTGSYLCPPLDGIWARAPYLHNGSVPTLDDLLQPASQRPTTFFRGNTKYDPVRGGFSTEPPVGADALRGFRFVTQEQDASLVGNSAKGHEYTFDSEDERRAVIAYLLTL